MKLLSLLKNLHGSRRISADLAGQGIYNRTGEPFHYSSIAAILINIRYMGILKSGEIKSAIIPDLQIIDERTFNYAQRLIFQRKSKQREYTSIPRSTLGKTLLSGNIFCGHCGGRLCSSTAKGGTERIPIYKCYNRVQHKGVCPGQTTYRAYRIDKTVEDILQNYLISKSKSKIKRIKEWSKTYSAAPLEVKKMIVSQLVKKVVVYHYNNIEVTFYEDWELKLF